MMITRFNDFAFDRLGFGPWIHAENLSFVEFDGTFWRFSRGWHWGVHVDPFYLTSGLSIGQ